MKSAKFYIALWAAKLSVIALKVTGHQGTNFPGRVVLKICPDFLRRAKGSVRVLGVTGTNGKTTTCNMLITMLKADGKKILDNNKGSNTMAGLCTSFVRDMTVGGRLRSDTAVLEIDERWSRVIFPMMTPDILMITNLTRDSIMRNGHPEYISKILTRSIPPETKLIINGDDLIASQVAPANDRVYFGIESLDSDVTECINLVNDLQICPKCHNRLRFTSLRYHHIGRAYCPECGFKSPECDYLATDVDTKAMKIGIRSGREKNSYRLLSSSVFNIYNTLAAIVYMRELGYEPERIEELLKETEIVKSRHREDENHGYRVIMEMSKDKNALASSRVFDYISSQEGRKELILMMNCLADSREWSENVCWLYDSDFEFLNNEDIINIVATGPRARDYYLRLKMAGIDDDRITLVENELDAPEALRLEENESIYVLYGTDSIDLAERVRERVNGCIKKKTTLSESEGGNRS